MANSLLHHSWFHIYEAFCISYVGSFNLFHINYLNRRFLPFLRIINEFLYSQSSVTINPPNCSLVFLCDYFIKRYGCFRLVNFLNLFLMRCFAALLVYNLLSHQIQKVPKFTGIQYLEMTAIAKTTLKSQEMADYTQRKLRWKVFFKLRAIGRSVGSRYGATIRSIVLDKKCLISIYTQLLFVLFFA